MSENYFKIAGYGSQWLTIGSGVYFAVLANVGTDHLQLFNRVYQELLV